MRHPSTTKTTSPTEGRSVGSGAVHERAIFTAPKNSSHSPNSGSRSTEARSKISVISPNCNIRFTRFAMSLSCTLKTAGLSLVGSSSNTVPKLCASASYVSSPHSFASGETYPSDPAELDDGVGSTGVLVQAVSPKSERCGSKSASKSTLFGFTSPCTIGGLHCVWRNEVPRAIPRAIRCRIGRSRTWLVCFEASWSKEAMLPFGMSS